MKAELPIQDRAVLLVEDEPEMAAEIKVELERCGYLVHVATKMPSAEQMRTGAWSLLILDRILCGADALPTLEAWRKQGIRIPVLIVSVLSCPEEVARGLKMGADDYLGKPFELVELGARVDALLRRLVDVPVTRLVFDDLEVDLIEEKAFRRGELLDLLPREFRLLTYFLRHCEEVITRRMLLRDLWQQTPSLESNVVNAHITNLRKKIDERGMPSRIANIRGVGFMLRKNSQES